MVPGFFDEEYSVNRDDHSGQMNTNDTVLSRLSRSSLVLSIALLLLILLAFALRLYALEGQSMWSDEGLSLHRALQSPLEVVNGLIVIDGVETRDTNPPLYFLLLHFWRNLTGDTILALRYSGVLAGTLAVPLTFVLGSVIFGKRVGLAAALLMAISPFHVWQSQVLRNYSMLLTLNLTSVYGLFRYVLAPPQKAQKRWLALWMVAGLLGIYTHYFGFFVFTFGVITLLVLVVHSWGIRGLVRQKWFWLFLAAGLLLMFPAVSIGLDRFQAGQQVDFYHVPLVQVLGQAAGAFSVGVEPDLQHPWFLVLPATILAFAGLLFAWCSSKKAAIILLGYQLIPLGLLLFLSTINPLYNGVRHLLIGLPPFLLFAAAGAVSTPDSDTHVSDNRKVWSLFRWLRLALFAVIIVIQVGWLYTQFTNSKLLRDDIRGAAEYLNRHAEADDLIILHDTIVGLTFDYYYDGAAPWRAIPSISEQDITSAEAAMEEAGMQGKRIWFLAEPTPRTGFSRTALWDWADANWPRFFSHEFPSMWLRVRLIGYVPEPNMQDLPQEVESLEVVFGDDLMLHGFEFPPLIKAGESWWSTFYWSKLQPGAGDYAISFRLRDDQGRQWGQDDELLWHDYLPEDWPEGAILRNDQDISMASGMPPGDYEIWLRVMDDEMQPLPVTTDQVDVYLGDIEVAASTEISDPYPFTTQKIRHSEVDFLGYYLPQDNIKPGHVIPIDLFWRVRQTPSQDYRLRAQLLNQEGIVIAESETAPTRINYPASQWQVGEVLQSKVWMTMPASVDTSPHSVRVMLVAPENGEMIADVTLKDKLTADPWPYVSELPPDLDPLDAVFGDPPSISLRGLDLPVSTASSGNPLDFALYWQANRDTSEEYLVFVHLTSSDETIAVQLDSAPVQGFRPTMSWREGEVIQDEYSIPIGSDVLPGTYHLWVGLYQPENLDRPITTVDGQLAPDGRVYLGEISVEQTE